DLQVPHRHSSKIISMKLYSFLRKVLVKRKAILYPIPIELLIDERRDTVWFLFFQEDYTLWSRNMQL
ncbi:MAG TPA: hypothetical protein PLQ41_09035, partial [bacterium]|nr:hypothetical protein [bacterium]